MIFLLGGGGFVGSAYVRLLERLGLEHEVITRENYDSFVGRSCEIMINANGNSKKFLADRDPKLDFDQSVRSVADSLIDFSAEKYIFLSTGDVYPKQDRPEITREDSLIDTRLQSRYGFHKHLAETIVLSRHPRALVMRMGGFVGTGMRKNAIFDMLNGQTLWLKPDSELQFINTDSAARIVWRLVEKGISGEIVNLGARGCVKIRDVLAKTGARSELSPEARQVRFELSTDKLASFYGDDLPSSIDEVTNFLDHVTGGGQY